jgi:hypothetical protein
MFLPKIMPGVGVGQSDVRTPTYTCSGGICKPSTPTAAGDFAGLQRSINVMLRLFNQGFQIDEDGVIGKQTVDAGGLVLSLQKRQAGGGAEWFAANARRLGEEFFKVSRQPKDFRPPVVGLPTSDDANLTRQQPPPQIQPQPPSPDQVTPLPETQPDAKKGVHWAWWVGGAVLIAAAGYFGYRYFVKPKGLSGADDHGYGEAVDDFIDV